jgi:hypothetical protein
MTAAAGARNIDRIAICQAFLGAGGNYLEIGVSRGDSFLPIRARAKWGVDPAPLLTPEQCRSRRRRAWLALRDERLFRMTSDDFFHLRSSWLRRRGVDVAFLDGLHTYQQTLTDVLNTVACLKPGGVIVLHDCNPATELAATPAESYEDMQARWPGFCGDWNGDVWKVIVHLRSLRADLDALVLDCDQGVGIVRRQPAQVSLELSASQIAALHYADLERDRARLLGLHPAEYLWEMLRGQR